MFRILKKGARAGREGKDIRIRFVHRQPEETEEGKEPPDREGDHDFGQAGAHLQAEHGPEEGAESLRSFYKDRRLQSLA